MSDVIVVSQYDDKLFLHYDGAVHEYGLCEAERVKRTVDTKTDREGYRISVLSLGVLERLCGPASPRDAENESQ